MFLSNKSLLFFKKLLFSLTLKKQTTWWWYAGGLPLTSQHRLENDHKRQCICQIRHEKMRGVRPVFRSCFDNNILFYVRKSKQNMKNRWTPVQWNNAIWLALKHCHVSMTCKINKSVKPGEPLSFFHALFGRCTTFYGHFLIDVLTSEGSTRISHHLSHMTWSSLQQ